jgi:hypothetical protein
LCDAAQIAPAEHRRDGLELDRRGCRVAFCGERTKDRRGKSKVGETGQVGNGLSVSVCRQCVRVNALRGRETTRAIRAVQMSAGDKDRTASTASVARSRRPDHVTQPRSTNTARLICWQIWRDQVSATFSAARVAAGRRIIVLSGRDNPSHVDKAARRCQSLRSACCEGRSRRKKLQASRRD